jgi:three-Cys-motif partner protein
MSNNDVYVGREQTLVKHFILREYVVRMAFKVASFCDTITYVDGFSGPWNAVSEDFSDSSFAIALAELRKAREVYKSKGRELKLRCFFVEKKKTAHSRLSIFVRNVTDAEIETRHATFESSVPEVVEFVRHGGSKNFTFLFIDPTGWTGFAMETLKPLLRLERVELLINFMTSHIRRFVDSPEEETQDSFERMFGSSDFRQTIQGLRFEEKEDALIGEYMTNLRKFGGFEYVAAAIVLDPLISRTHFHMIYATRHPIGLQVFKDVERKAMDVMVTAQADAHRNRRLEESDQQELFGSRDLFNPRHYQSLRAGYLRKSQRLTLEVLEKRKRVPYDVAWKAAVSFPLVWESDLKEWVRIWKRDGLLRIEGLRGKQHVPQVSQDHTLDWQDGSSD